ncbi:XRE family transcriptional regulator [Ancylobacter sp. G4_0304]|uniref:XRE family transcriptional regulator n=1 Tax=Ancylobacter sp. G4_0304 TaxID=3114289 RepID=UPI0039C5F805
MSIGERIRTFREANGWTLAEMADRLDVQISAQSLGRYELSKRVPDADLLAAIVRLGCDPVALLMGPGASQPQAQSQSQSMAPKTASMIERLAFRASAGNGFVALDETGETVPIHDEVLRRLNLRAEHARYIEADGDSMVPTLHHGDPMIIDVSPDARARIRDGAIYVFRIGDEAYVKRLRREPGTIIMMSDNRDAFPERAVPAGEAFKIIGRVRWGEREL